MPKSPREALEDIVPHPRYGDAVVPSGSRATEQEVRSSYWGYRRATIFAESAIVADITRQNFSTFPRSYYVDMLRKCRTCERSFLFFAREQKHWYEVLRFYVDAECDYCPGCRRSNRQLRLRFQRYSENVGRANLSDEELATLVGDAVFLRQAGVIRNEQQLRRLRNLAQRRIPRSKATQSIAKLLAGP